MYDIQGVVDVGNVNSIYKTYDASNVEAAYINQNTGDVGENSPELTELTHGPGWNSFTTACLKTVKLSHIFCHLD